MATIQEYIDAHNLSRKVEEVINATCKAKPEEPAAFMVRCFVVGFVGFCLFSLLCDQRC